MFFFYNAEKLSLRSKSLYLGITLRVKLGDILVDLLALFLAYRIMRRMHPFNALEERKERAGNKREEEEGEGENIKYLLKAARV